MLGHSSQIISLNPKGRVLLGTFYVVSAYLVGLQIVKERYLIIFWLLFLLQIVFFVKVLKDNSFILRDNQAGVYIPDRISGQDFKTPLLITLMGILILNIIAPGNPTIFEHFFANLTIILAILPTFVYLRRPDIVPFMPMLGAIYVLLYASPIFVHRNYDMINIGDLFYSLVYPAGIKKGIVLSAVGFFSLLLSYYKIPGRKIGRFIPKLSIYLDLQKAKSYSIFLGILGLICTYTKWRVTIPMVVSQVFNLVESLSIISIGILFILQMKKKLDFIGKGILWGIFVPAKILMESASGHAYCILKPIMFIFLAYWVFRKGIPWKWVLIAVIIGIPLIAATKGEFRELTWVEKRSGWSSFQDMIDRIAVYPSTFWRYMTGQIPYGDSFEYFMLRTSRVAEFGRVINYTPQLVPYLKGESYRILTLWRSVPRLIYKDKPIGSDIELYGHRYDVQHPTDYTSSSRLPQLIEMYINFGPMGVVIGMFLVGIAYRTFYEMLCHPSAGEGGLLIAIFIFVKLLDIEGDLSVLVMVVYDLIFFILILSPIRSKGVYAGT